MSDKRRKLSYVQAMPGPVEHAIAQLGANIATARLRRRWRQEDLARKAGITRLTVAAIERGKPGTGIGAYAAALWALGLHGKLSEIAAPETDEEGMALEAARLGERARPTTSLSDDF